MDVKRILITEHILLKNQHVAQYTEIGVRLGTKHVFHLCKLQDYPVCKLQRVSGCPRMRNWNRDSCLLCCRWEKL